MDLEQLLKDSVIPFLKNLGKQSYNNKKEKVEPYEGYNDKVEPYEGYNDIVEKYKRILVHSEGGCFPDSLFEKRAPNETEEEFEYRKQNFKQITLPVFLDYLNTRGRAWHNSNWSIIYQEDDKLFGENTLQEYLEDGLYLHGSLVNFCTTTMAKVKAQDPNGVIIVKPYKYDFKEVEGEVKIDDQKLLEPTCYYYSCENVLAYEEENHALVILEEKSIVTKENKQVKAGYILEYHTPLSYYEIRQVGKYNDFSFEITEILNHNFGQMLARRLEGIPAIKYNKMFFESPFGHCIDHLDLALLKASNLFIAESKSAYPVRIMLGNECDFFDGQNKCVGGNIFEATESGVPTMKQCPSCKGTGLKNRISPNGELLFNGKDLSDQNVSSNEIMRYVSPDSDILKYLREGIEIDINAGRKILHLSTTSDVANTNSETATFNNLENKALLSFVSQIANQEFDMYAFCIDAIGWLRYGTKYKRPTLVRPNSFDFTTENDYLTLLKTARESNVPAYLLRVILNKYISNLYFSTTESAKEYALLVNVDRIFEYNNDEVKTKLAQGTITDIEAIIHDSGSYIIEQLKKESQNFLDMPFETQKQMVIEKAQSLVSNQQNG